MKIILLYINLYHIYPGMSKKVQIICFFIVLTDHLHFYKRFLFLLFFPVVKFRQLLFKKGSRFIFRETFRRQMFDQKICQLRKVCINIFSIGVAPFAIFFIECSVCFTAYRGIVKRHSAALAYKFSRRTQNRID